LCGITFHWLVIIGFHNIIFNKFGVCKYNQTIISKNAIAQAREENVNWSHVMSKIKNLNES